MKKYLLAVALTIAGMIAVYFAIGKIQEHNRYGHLSEEEATLLKKRDAEDELRRKCFSEEGYHINLVKIVRRNLLDPSSFQHVTTEVLDADHEGSYILYMEYRAKNSFGGPAIGWVEAEMNLHDCESIRIVASK